MSEQMTINAEKALNNENMREFLSNLFDTEQVALVQIKFVGNDIATKQIIANKMNQELRSMFEDDEIAGKVEQIDNLALIGLDNGTTMTFLKQDYFWYFKRPRRLNSLFATEVKEKPQKQTPVEVRINIACGTKKDGKIENIECLTGNEKELVNFINEQYTNRLLRSFFKDRIVFNIAYESEEELNDEGMWFTFDELKEGGIIEV